MGTARTVTIVVTNEEFDLLGGSIGPTGAIPPRRRLPRQLSALRCHKTQDEFAFYGLVLSDEVSLDLLGVEWALRGNEPAAFMDCLASWVEPELEELYEIALTFEDGSQLEPHDDMTITACTVGELAGVYTPLLEVRAAELKFSQESPVLHELFGYITGINRSPRRQQNIVLCVWE